MEGESLGGNGRKGSDDYADVDDHQGGFFSAHPASGGSSAWNRVVSRNAVSSTPESYPMSTKTEAADVTAYRIVRADRGEPNRFLLLQPDQA